MYGSIKLQLRWYCTTLANAEAMDLNSVDAIFFWLNLQCLNCNYNSHGQIFINKTRP